MREVRIVKNPFLASWFIPATLPFIRSRDICRSSEKADILLVQLVDDLQEDVWNLM